MAWQLELHMSHADATTVSLQALPDYTPDRVLAAMRACLAPWGGMSAFVRPGQRVLLKPNLLGPFPVERAVTTHPAVVRAAIRLVQEAGGRPCVGDSPAMGLTAGVRSICGLDAVLAETGAEWLDFSTPLEFAVPRHQVAPRLTLARVLSEVDVVISLPKLKTHAQMTLTAALKNQYGCIPGALKTQWHFRLQEAEWLAALILDIHRAVRPTLAIVDAVVAMEGDGPSGGDPRRLGALLAGPDLAAVDTVACALIGLDPMRVPTLAVARRQGGGETHWERIAVVGADWHALAQPDFKKVAQPAAVLRMLPLPRPALNWLRRQWTLRPEIVDGRCTRCGLCERGCPVSPAAILPDAAPGARGDDTRCIRCYCCHEFCPAGAIVLRAPWLARVFPLERLADGVGRTLGRLVPRRGR